MCTSKAPPAKNIDNMWDDSCEKKPINGVAVRLFELDEFDRSRLIFALSKERKDC